MNKNKLSLCILAMGLYSSIQALEQYNVIITSNDIDYVVGDSYIPTGEVSCSSSSHLEIEVYKNVEFQKTESDCLETYRTVSGEEKYVEIDDIISNSKGTLLLSSCNEILKQGHSLGSKDYPIIYLNNEIDVNCDMTTDGGGWTRWWWYNGNGVFPNENDVLGYDFGTMDNSSHYAFQTLPSTLIKSNTELLAKDGEDTILKWDFSNGGNTSSAVWNSFTSRTIYMAEAIKNSSAWNPTVINGSFSSTTQDSWMYREESGVKTFILDDDNCDCQSSLSAGASICGASWNSNYGGAMSYGVDNLNDVICDSTKPNKSMTMFFREK